MGAGWFGIHPGRAVAVGNGDGTMMTKAGPAARPLSSRRSSEPSREALPAPGAHVHLMGIAGAGMRGLAVLLAADGYRVSGCDKGEGPAELRALGVELWSGHDPAHVADVSLVIRSSAVPPAAPELEAAREAGVPVLKRARALGAVLAGRPVAGVAGTHGKTTITAMTGRALEAAGLDPTVVVGGEVEAWDGYARAGRGEWAVVEADEYDRSFLELDPWLAVVSSLEAEHLDTYGGVTALREAFLTFSRRALPRRGALCCADDPGARGLAEALAGAGEVRTYGRAADADYRVEGGEPGPDGARRCRLTGPEGEVEFLLAVPGDHNLQNAAAALAVAFRLGADIRAAAGALAGFGGVARRLQLLADLAGVAVVDDYAHHPTEVRASLEALRRRWPERRLVAVFQPHLFSRTRDFATAFGSALGAADRALVLPIYPSREEPIPGVTSELVVEAAPRSVRAVTAEQALEAVAVAGEGPAVFAFMGAGDVTELAHRAAAGLRGSGEVGA